MYDDFKIANYSNSLVSPEFYARPLSRLFKGDVIDGLTVVPGTGLKVTLQPGNAMLRYGSAAAASARMVSLVADFSLDIPAPDASNPRIDAVVLYVDNSVNLPVVDASNPPTSANLDGPGVAKAKIVSGTPAANPVAPSDVAIQAAVGAGNSFTVLSLITIDPGISVVASSKIRDSRKFADLKPLNLASMAFAMESPGATLSTTRRTLLSKTFLATEFPAGSDFEFTLTASVNFTWGGNGASFNDALFHVYLDGVKIAPADRFQESKPGVSAYNVQTPIVAIGKMSGGVEHTIEVTGELANAMTGVICISGRTFGFVNVTGRART